jgi:multiple sugar transport system ATP-binding protein
MKLVKVGWLGLADVVIRDLVKVFGKTVAVDGLSLEISDGEFVCLLGPSGCGKTTTFRCIAGLERPGSGEIYIGGELVNDLPPQKRDIAMVFQSFALYPSMNVYENLAFPLRKRKLPEQEINFRIKRIAEILRMENLLYRDPLTLSGGEKQRVALGRALVREPRVLLLDEPLLNLDAKLREIMRGELKELQKRLKITTIFATPDPVEAMSMADRIAVMKDGKLQQYDTPENLYNKPKNLFVAEFTSITSPNIILCYIEKSRDGVVLRIGGSAIYIESYTLLSKLQEEKLELPRKATLFIRSSDVNVDTKPFEGSLGRAKVKNLQYLGSKTLYELSFDDIIIKALSNRSDLKIGSEVWFSFNIDKTILFA